MQPWNRVFSWLFLSFQKGGEFVLISDTEIYELCVCVLNDDAHWLSVF